MGPAAAPLRDMPPAAGHVPPGGGCPQAAQRGAAPVPAAISWLPVSWEMTRSGSAPQKCVWHQAGFRTSRPGIPTHHTTPLKSNISIDPPLQRGAGKRPRPTGTVLPEQGDAQSSASITQPEFLSKWLQLHPGDKLQVARLSREEEEGYLPSLGYQESPQGTDKKLLLLKASQEEGAALVGGAQHHARDCRRHRRRRHRCRRHCCRRHRCAKLHSGTCLCEQEADAPRADPRVLAANNLCPRASQLLQGARKAG